MTTPSDPPWAPRPTLSLCRPTPAARGETRLYLAARGIDLEAHGHAPEPRPTSERVARALTKSSSERLALDGTAVTSSSDAELDRIGVLEKAEQPELLAARAAARVLGRWSLGDRVQDGEKVRGDLCRAAVEEVNAGTLPSGAV